MPEASSQHRERTPVTDPNRSYRNGLPTENPSQQQGEAFWALLIAFCCVLGLIFFIAGGDLVSSSDSQRSTGFAVNDFNENPVGYVSELFFQNIDFWLVAGVLVILCMVLMVIFSAKNTKNTSS